VAVGEGQSGNESNFPTFEFNEAGVQEFVTGAIDKLIRNAHEMARVQKDTTVREHEFNRMHKRMIREELDIDSACLALDGIVPRTDEQNSEGWAAYVHNETYRRLNPGPLPQSVVEAIDQSMPQD